MGIMALDGAQQQFHDGSRIVAIADLPKAQGAEKSKLQNISALFPRNSFKMKVKKEASGQRKTVLFGHTTFLL